MSLKCRLHLTLDVVDGVVQPLVGEAGQLPVQAGPVHLHSAAKVTNFEAIFVEKTNKPKKNIFREGPNASLSPPIATSIARRSHT